MSEQANDSAALQVCAEKLSAAADALNGVLGKLEAQYESLNQKVDRIIASIEEMVCDAEKNEELNASAEKNRATRKTLPAIVTTLLAKGGVDVEPRSEAAVEKALQSLSVEQRIAVKAEMARAGLL